MSIKTAILGVTGYSGEELLRILVNHPEAEVTYLAAKDKRKEHIRNIYTYLPKDWSVDSEVLDVDQAMKKADVFFLSLPHSVSMQIAPTLIEKGKKVIDISADYRLKSKSDYDKVYGFEHTDESNLSNAVYGLPEVYRDQIKNAELVANPGCYPTATLLGLWPLLKNKITWDGALVVDAKSGVTGAGRKAKLPLMFSEVDENFKAYGVMSHPHQAEIDQLCEVYLPGLKRVFIPHLVPMDRGILCTIYAQTNGISTTQGLREVFEKTYANEPFVKLLPEGVFPQTKSVSGTNQCHIGLAYREDAGTAVIVTVIDNLQKGASAQAVQNFNLMHDFNEQMGLH